MLRQASVSHLLDVTFPSCHSDVAHKNRVGRAAIWGGVWFQVTYGCTFITPWDHLDTQILQFRMMRHISSYGSTCCTVLDVLYTHGHWSVLILYTLFVCFQIRQWHTGTVKWKQWRRRSHMNPGSGSRWKKTDDRNREPSAWSTAFEWSSEGHFTPKQDSRHCRLYIIVLTLNSV